MWQSADVIERAMQDLDPREFPCSRRIEYKTLTIGQWTTSLLRTWRGIKGAGGVSELCALSCPMWLQIDLNGQPTCALHGDGHPYKA